jgi:Ca2+/H+ antiporter, TMEM165/GDT1 family
MDIFLQVLLCVLVASIGDAPQLLAAVVAMHYAKMREVVVGVVLASAFNVVISVGAGASLHGAVLDGTIDPRFMMLIQAAGFLTAGLAMLFLRPKVRVPKNDGHGALFAVFVTMAALQLLDKSQFLMATFTARHGQPVMVGTAGFLGLMLALIPAIFLRERLGAMLPLPLIRRIGGGIFCLVAVALVIRALGLVAV